MMKYYVIADVHGFYTETVAALEEAGFFAETEPCKLIVCGDMLDRGKGIIAIDACTAFSHKVNCIVVED